MLEQQNYVMLSNGRSKKHLIEPDSFAGPIFGPFDEVICTHYGKRIRLPYENGNRLEFLDVDADGYIFYDDAYWADVVFFSSSDNDLLSNERDRLTEFDASKLSNPEGDTVARADMKPVTDDGSLLETVADMAHIIGLHGLDVSNFPDIQDSRDFPQMIITMAQELENTHNWDEDDYLMVVEEWTMDKLRQDYHMVDSVPEEKTDLQLIDDFVDSMRTFWGRAAEEHYYGIAETFNIAYNNVLAIQTEMKKKAKEEAESNTLESCVKRLTDVLSGKSKLDMKEVLDETITALKERNDAIHDRNELYWKLIESRKLNK